MRAVQRPGARLTAALGAFAALAATGLAGLPSPAGADPVAAPARPADPRIRVLPYEDDRIYMLTGHYGYQIALEFASDERIENVSIGDSAAWQVTPNRRADTLFIKPVEAWATTNMAVVTTRRRYAFELVSAEAGGPGDPDILYRVRFSYPDADEGGPEAPPPAETRRNTDYTLDGAPAFRPSRVEDDGARTYFTWPPGAPVPALFALDLAGEESLVNFAVDGATLIVERIAPAFRLRFGDEEVLVRNRGWSPPDPGPDAPPTVRRGASWRGAGNGPR